MHNKIVADNNNLEIRQPIIIVGIGGAGSKLAVNSSKLLGCKCILISHDKEDLDENHDTILINSSSWINPSTYKLDLLPNLQQAKFDQLSMNLTR